MEGLIFGILWYQMACYEIASAQETKNCKKNSKCTRNKNCKYVLSLESNFFFFGGIQLCCTVMPTMGRALFNPGLILAAKRRSPWISQAPELHRPNEMMLLILIMNTVEAFLTDTLVNGHAFMHNGCIHKTLLFSTPVKTLSFHTSVSGQIQYRHLFCILRCLLMRASTVIIVMFTALLIITCFSCLHGN